MGSDSKVYFSVSPKARIISKYSNKQLKTDEIKIHVRMLRQEKHKIHCTLPNNINHYLRRPSVLIKYTLRSGL